MKDESDDGRISVSRGNEYDEDDFPITCEVCWDNDALDEVFDLRLEEDDSVLRYSLFMCPSCQTSLEAAGPFKKIVRGDMVLYAEQGLGEEPSTRHLRAVLHGGILAFERFQ